MRKEERLLKGKRDKLVSVFCILHPSYPRPFLLTTSRIFVPISKTGNTHIQTHTHTYTHPYPLTPTSTHPHAPQVDLIQIITGKNQQLRNVLLCMNGNFVLVETGQEREAYFQELEIEGNYFVSTECQERLKNSVYFVLLLKAPMPLGSVRSMLSWDHCLIQNFTLSYLRVIIQPILVWISLLCQPPLAQDFLFRSLFLWTKRLIKERRRPFLLI